MVTRRPRDRTRRNRMKQDFSFRGQIIIFKVMKTIFGSLVGKSLIRSLLFMYVCIFYGKEHTCASLYQGDQVYRSHFWRHLSILWSNLEEGRGVKQKTFQIFFMLTFTTLISKINGLPMYKYPRECEFICGFWDMFQSTVYSSFCDWVTEIGQRLLVCFIVALLRNIPNKILRNLQQPYNF